MNGILVIRRLKPRQENTTARETTASCRWAKAKDKMLAFPEPFIPQIVRMLSEHDEKKLYTVDDYNGLASWKVSKTICFKDLSQAKMRLMN